MKTRKIQIERSLVALEFKLVRRNRSVRHLFITGPIIFLALTCGVLLLPKDLAADSELVFILCLYLSITYSVLAFTWDALNGERILGLPLPAEVLIRARLYVSLILACVTSAVMSTVTLLIRPELILLPVATAVYTVAVCTIPMLMVALKKPRRLDANAPPLKDLKKFGPWDYVTSILAFLPVYTLLVYVSYQSALIFLISAAGIGLVLLPIQLKRAALMLNSAAPALADTFANDRS